MRDRSKQLEYRRQYRRNLRIEVINAYGGKCNKCGFTDIRALCIDHINGGGLVEYRSLSSHADFYNSLRRRKFPSGYQVLCANCNMIKTFENNESKNVNRKLPI
jgi:hypothetical protein